MKTKFISCAVLYCFSCFSACSLGEVTTASVSPAATATTFLKHLDKGEIDQALQLWTAKDVNQRLKERMTAMSSKIKRLGGIKNLKTPDVENRPKNLASHEVVVIVLYGNNKDLALGSFSFVEENGQYQISSIRSEQGYGGTTSLFE